MKRAIIGRVLIVVICILVGTAACALTGKCLNGLCTR